MLIAPLIGLGGVSVVLLLAEVLWQAKLVKRAEVSRKFVHILAGTIVAFWPFFMPFWTIQVLSAMLLVVVWVSKRLRVFKSIHAVKRPTYGEYLFPIGIGLAATLANSPWIYAIAMLHLSLADGFAAIVGTPFIGRNGYKVFGQSKTPIGTVTFYLVSLFITIGLVLFASDSYGATASALILWLPLSTTLVENVAVYGTDNILIPLLVVGVLNSLQAIG